jgi:SAM-dependent methyltransferase
MDVGMRDELEERSLRGLHEFLEDFVAEVPRSTPVLDMGCGSGAWLARLKRLGFGDLWGVDSDVQPNVPDFTFIRVNLDHERPRLGRKFGLITAIEVFEHLANPGAALSFISEHLADGGFALVTSPNIQSLRYRLRFLLTGKLPSFDEKGDASHISPLLLAGFRKVAGRFHLDIVRCWTYPPKGTMMFRWPIRSAARFLRLALPDPYPGDSLCIQIARRAGT